MWGKLLKSMKVFPAEKTQVLGHRLTAQGGALPPGGRASPPPAVFSLNLRVSIGTLCSPTTLVPLYNFLPDLISS